VKQLLVNVLLVAAFVGMVVLLVLWGRLLAVVIPRRMKQRVIDDMAARKLTLLSIENVRFFSLLVEKNTRRWRVEFRDAGGRRGSGLAQTSIITGLKWLEGPALKPWSRGERDWPTAAASCWPGPPSLRPIL